MINQKISKLVCSITTAALIGFMQISMSQAAVKGPGWYLQTLESMTPEQAEIYLDNAAPAKEQQMSRKVIANNIDATASEALLIQETSLAPTDTIGVLAQGLNNDPIKIFEYVKNRINFDPYFGLLKGAELTLLDRSGNDFDQSALLFELLNRAGYTPQYVYGTMTIPVQNGQQGRDMISWLGIISNGNLQDTNRAVRGMLNSGGIPNDSLSLTDTGVSFFRLSRIWVRVDINGTIYNLDPAFKKVRQRTSDIDLLAASGFDRTELLNAAGGTLSNTTFTSVQGINADEQGGLNSKLTEYTTNLINELQQNYSGSSVDEILQRFEIDDSPITELPSGLFFPHNDFSVWDEIPAQYMHTLRFQHASIDQTVPVSEIAGKKLSLHYENLITNRVLANNQNICGFQTEWQFGSIHQSQRSPLTPFTCTFSTEDSNFLDITYFVELMDTDNGAFRIVTKNNQGENVTGVRYSGRAFGNSTESSDSFGIAFYGHNDYFEDGVQNGSFFEPGNKTGLAKITITTRSRQNVFTTVEHEFSLSGRLHEEPLAIFSLDDEPVFGIDEPTYQNNHGPLTITVDHPYTAFDGTASDQFTDYNVIKGATYVVGSSFGETQNSILYQNRQRFLQEVFAEDSSANDTEKLTELLNFMGLTWARQQTVSTGLLAGFADVRLSRPHSIGLIGFTNSYFVDYKTQITSFNERIAGQAVPASLFPSTSFFASALEHGVLEQLQGVDRESVSTIKVLDDGNELGNRTLLLTSDLNLSQRQVLLDNGDGYSEGLVDLWDSYYSADSLERFDFVLLPESPSQINEYSGNGYVAYQPPTGDGTAALDGRIFMAIGGGVPFLNGGFASFVGPPEPGPVVRDTVADLSRPAPRLANFSRTECPVNLNTGAKEESRTDISVGPISFTRFYDSLEKDQMTSVGLGWRHSLDISALIHSDENSALGFRSPADMAPIIVAQLATLSLVGDEPRVRDWTIASLVNSWAMNQLQDNAVTIRGGNSSDTFLRLPDGSYLSPPQNTSTLTRENGLFKLTGRFGSVTQFNSDNQIASLTDIDGNAVNFSYENKRLITVSDTRGNTLTLSYAGGMLSQIQDQSGRTVIYAAENGLLRFITDVEGNVWENRYDAIGRLESRLDPLGQTIKQVTYNAVGKVDTQSFPRQAGLATEQYLYGESESQVIDPLGNSTRTIFDNQNRTSQVVDALGRSSTQDYDGASRVVSSQDMLGHVFSFQYDYNNNLLERRNPLNEVQTFEYDSQNRLERSISPLGNVSQITYDAKHHPKTQTNFPSQGEAITVVTDYFPDGQVSTVTDAKGAVTRSTYDSQGNIDKVNTTFQDGDLQVTTPNVDRDFDALGRLERITDQEGAVTAYSYNNLGNIETITDPQGQVTTMSYDELGRLKTTTDRNDSVSTVEYTVSGQVDNVNYPGVEEDVTFTYDLRDQVKTMVDSLGTTTFDYDAIGRLESQEDPNGFSVIYDYDEVGNLATLTYPGDKQVLYTYDAANRLKSMINWLGQTVRYHYDLGGRLDFIENANGTVSDYTFDGANRLTRLVDRKSNGEIISEQVFTLDPNGNPETEFRIQPQAPQETASELGYLYNDKKTRLISIRDSEDNQTLSTFTYDDEGQQTQKSDDLRTFDSRHRLRTQSNKAYSYDANDNRLLVVTGDELRYFIYDSSNRLLAEANANKEIIRYYIYSAGLNQMIQNNQSYTYHYNSQGHTLAITDQNEEVQNQYAYSPFGRILGETEASGLEQPFKYVGMSGVQHEQGEIYYMRARYYDAGTGRFLKEDPIGIDGGLNVSLYVGGNPVVGVDPSGLIPCIPCVTGGVNALLDFGTQLVQNDFDITRVNEGQVGLAFVAGFVGGGAGVGISRGLTAGRAAGFVSAGESIALEITSNAVAGAVITNTIGLSQGESSSSEISGNLGVGGIAGALGAAVDIVVPGTLGDVAGGVIRGAARQAPAAAGAAMGFLVSEAAGAGCSR